MAQIERTKNTITGAIWGVIERLASILLPFVVRTILIQKLGSEYLGLSSLFNSILQVLNLTELGFGSAAVFAMYKPISEDNYATVGAIIAYLRKVYKWIGMFIILVSILFLPFINLIISGDVPRDVNIYTLYVIYVFNTAISYLLFAYKTSLLSALQLNSIINKVAFFTNSSFRIAQILVLLVFSNYYVYVILIPVFSIISNLVSSLIVDKNYKEWLVYGELDLELKNNIRKRLFPLMSTKVGSVMVNAADTLIISAFLGLKEVAIYNNYYYILNAVRGFLLVIYSSMQAGIGNALVVDSHEKIMKDFKKFCFINNWIVTLCTACLLCLYQPFMELWVGRELMLSFNMVILFCVYFYIGTIQRIVVVYKDAAGIWREDMFRSYFGSILNLVVDIVTVRYIGLYGVIGSSILANLVAVPWMGAILYKTVFKENSKLFYLTEIRDLVVAVIICSISYIICSYCPNGFVGIAAKAVVCVVLSNVLLYIVYHKDSNYNQMMTWIKSIVMTKIKG